MVLFSCSKKSKFSELKGYSKVHDSETLPMKSQKEARETVPMRLDSSTEVEV